MLFSVKTTQTKSRSGLHRISKSIQQVMNREIWRWQWNPGNRKIDQHGGQPVCDANTNQSSNVIMIHGFQQWFTAFSKSCILWIIWLLPFAQQTQEHVEWVPLITSHDEYRRRMRIQTTVDKMAALQFITRGTFLQILRWTAFAPFGSVPEKTNTTQSNCACSEWICPITGRKAVSGSLRRKVRGSASVPSCACAWAARSHWTQGSSRSFQTLQSFAKRPRLGELLLQSVFRRTKSVIE